jgi:hypothetical protein
VAIKPANRKPADSGRQPSFSWRFAIGNLLFFMVGVLVCLAAHFFGILPTRTTLASSIGITRNSATNQDPPWGRIEATPIFLERPEEFAAITNPIPTELQWFFPRKTATQLTTFFQSCGLPEDMIREVVDTNRWRITPTEIVIVPPMELVRHMDPVPRERIYRLLAQSEKNNEHRHPYYSKQDFDEWFADCRLPSEKLEQIRRMTYTRKGVLCFSDSGYLEMTLGREEMLEVSQTLSRVPSLLVRLRVTPETDVEAVLKYWGTRSRSSKIKPLLESAKRIPEGTILNISWFFPPVPRLLLYSYPNPAKTIAGKYPDCYWTALNFFKDTPDDRLLGENSGDTLQAGFEHIPKAERFGDVILFYQKDGPDVLTVHTCVFIADNIVFTKNGYDPRQPWVLMRMDDMMFKYITDKPLAMAAFRSKER